MDIFFFDFDGVLADSVAVKTVAFGRLFEEFGTDIRDRVVAHHLENGGMSRFDKFHHYYSEFLGRELDDEGMKLLCERFSALVVDEVVRSAEIPGANSFVSEAAEIAPCYIVSATPEDEIREIVKRRGLDRFFAGICGSPTKKSEHVAAILEECSADPARCVFFGDAMSDLQAAESCGVPFVGILPHKNAPLLRERADIRWVHDFTELLARDFVKKD